MISRQTTASGLFSNFAIALTGAKVWGYSDRLFLIKPFPVRRLVRRDSLKVYVASWPRFGAVFAH